MGQVVTAVESDLVSGVTPMALRYDGDWLWSQLVATSSRFNWLWSQSGCHIVSLQLALEPVGRPHHPLPPPHHDDMRARPDHRRLALDLLQKA